MMISSFPLPCGARLVTEQDDDPCRGLYGPSWLGAAGLVRCRLDNLPVTLEEAKKLVAVSSGRYRGGNVSVSYGQAGWGMLISGIGLTAAEANAIADGTDPLTVLGVYPARVVLSIVRLPVN